MLVDVGGILAMLMAKRIVGMEGPAFWDLQIRTHENTASEERNLVESPRSLCILLPDHRLRALRKRWTS